MRLRERWRAMPAVWRRQAAAAVAAIAAVVVLVGVWWVPGLGGGPGRTEGQTVAGFFLAQRDGDCEALLDLVSEQSWSRSGRTGRDEFLDRCADALDGYEPAVHAVGLTTGRDPDRAGVDDITAARYGIELDHDGRPTRGPDPGSLVREGGEWKVRTGDVLLAIGRSPEETVAGFAAAYDRGDCDGLLDHLAEAAWSREGALDRDGFLDDCTETLARVHDGPTRPRPLALTTSRLRIDGDRATAFVGFAASAVPIMGTPPGGEVAFVKEGLEWKIEGDPDDDPADRADPTVPFPAVAWAHLEGALVDEIALPGGTCTDHRTVGDDDLGVDLRRRALDRAPGRQAVRLFPGCDLDVGLYQLDDEAAARAAVGRWQAGILVHPVLAGSREAPVPGVADAAGVLTGCDAAGCRDAVVLAARGSRVVIAESEVGRLDDAVAALQQQLGRW